MRKAGFVLVAAVLAACGNRANVENGPARPGGARKIQAVTDNREKMSPVVPPQPDVPGNRVPGVADAQARLELNEYEIRMPDTLAAGHHSFTVVNSGKANHSLVVEGNGLHTALAQQLTRGDSAQLDVDLKPGLYTFYCPVDGHKGKGMTRTVTVQ